MIRDNDYSTVVDLEEEYFEIDRFAFKDQHSNMITYLEADKRCQI